MKRITQILSILLVACIFAALLATTVFAADTYNDELGQLSVNANNVERLFHQYLYPLDDMEDMTVGTTPDADSMQGGLDTYAHVTFAENGTNTYLQIMQDGDGTATKEQYFQINGGCYLQHNVPDTAYGAYENKYIVVDFDICADKYYDTVEGKLVDEPNANTVLAYPGYAEAGQMSIGFMFRSDAVSAVLNLSFTSYIVYLDKTIGGVEYKGWYITTAGASKVTNAGQVLAKLSDVAGEWNHITAVIAFDQTVNYYDAAGLTGNATLGEYDKDVIAAIEAGTHETYKSYDYNITKSKLYFYCDGELAKEVDIFSSNSALDDPASWAGQTSTHENIGLYVVRFQISKAYVNGNYSFGFDNAVVNYYKNAYSGDLDTFLATDPKAPIYTVKDVVYNSYYDTPDPIANTNKVYANATDELPVKSIEKAWGAVDYAVENSGYAVITESVENYRLPAGQNPSAFFVKTENGATFALAEGSGYTAAEAPDENGYIKYSTASELDVLWFDSEETYLNALNFSVKSILKVGDSLMNDAFVIAGDTYMGNGKTLSFAGWYYSVEEDAPLVELDGDVFTQELYSLAKENDGALYLVPRYAETDAYFVIEKNSVETPYGHDVDITEVVGSLVGTFKVTLYDDVYGTTTNIATTEDFFTIRVGAYCTFDLNGHKIVFDYELKGNSAPCVFHVFEYTDLNIYSSASGAVIMTPGTVIKLWSTGDGDEKLESINVRFAEAANPEYSGDNLTVYCGALINLYADAYASNQTLFKHSTNVPTIEDENGNYVPNHYKLPKIAIKGGTYHRYFGFSYALIMFRGAGILNAEDATFTSAIGKILTTDSRYHSYVHATFTECVLMAQVENKPTDLVRELQTGSTVIFDGCTISGSFGMTAGALTLKNFYYISSSEVYLKAENLPEDKKGTAITSSKSNVSENAIKDPDYERISDGGTIMFVGHNKIHNATGLDSMKVIDRTSTAFGYIYESVVISYQTPTLNSETHEITYSQVDVTVNLNRTDVLSKEFVSGLRANLTTNNGFFVNVYIPAGSDVSKVYSDSEMTEIVDIRSYDESYDVVTLAYPAGAVGTLYFYLEQTDANGEVFAQRVGLSLSDYFETVLEKENVTAAEKSLIVNAANYCNELYKVAKAEAAGYDKYNDIISTNSALVIVPENLESTQVNLLPSVVTSASVIIGEGNIPMFAFTVAGAETVSASYADITGEVATVVLEKYDYVTGEGEDAVTVTYYVIKNMSVYDMIGEITVYADGEDALVYSINDYINNTDNTIAKALWGYANAVIAYKTQK